MNNPDLTNTVRPKYLTVTRVVFTIIFILLIRDALDHLISAVYFNTQPLDSTQFTDNGSRYYAQGPVSYMNIPYTYFAFPSDTVITNVRLFLVSNAVVHFFAYSIPYLFLMNTGRKLFKVLAQSYTPFTNEVTLLLKRAGWIMIFIGFFSKLILHSAMNLINLHRLLFENPYELNWLFTGAITLLLSGIFARGCQLQEEADTTL